MMQYDLLSILTPYLLKSAKKWVGAAQKTNSDKGGLKITIWVKFVI